MSAPHDLPQLAPQEGGPAAPDVYVIRIYQRQPEGLKLLGTFHSVKLGTTCRFHNEGELLCLIQGAMDAVEPDDQILKGCLHE